MTFEGAIKYPAVFLGALVVSLVLTPVVARLATSLGMIDRAGPRRINKSPIPRGGGLAVFVAFHFGCTLKFLGVFPEARSIIDFAWWLAFLAVSSGVLLIGWIDDLRGLSPLSKLAGQFLAASAMFWLDVRVAKVIGFELPLLVDYCATVFWFLAITNSFNLIDGLDGLATGLGLIASIGIGSSLVFRGAPGDSLLFASLAGALLGFLRFNFHPASIFLGDCGSLFIGFTLAALSLATTSKGTFVASIGVPILALGVPIFDTSLAIWRRSIRKMFPTATNREPGTGVMQVDMDHLHHRLLKAGLNQSRAAIALYAANLALVVIGLLSVLYSSHAGGIFLLTSVVGSYVVMRHVTHIEVWDSGSALVQGISGSRAKNITFLLAPLLDLILLTSLLLGTLAITKEFPTLEELKRAWLGEIPVWAAFPLLGIFITRTYSRVWDRARPTDFAILALSVAAGCAVSVSISSILTDGWPTLSIEQILIYSSSSVIALTGVRTIPRLAQDLLALYGGEPHRKIKRIAIYGAGRRGLLFLHRHTRDITTQTEKIVGLFDDDRNLWKRLVHGVEVEGGFRSLRRAIQRETIDEVVITTELSEKRLNRLFRLAEHHGLTLIEWVPRQNTLVTAGIPKEPRLTVIVGEVKNLKKAAN